MNQPVFSHSLRSFATEYVFVFCFKKNKLVFENQYKEIEKEWELRMGLIYIASDDCSPFFHLHVVRKYRKSIRY